MSVRVWILCFVVALFASIGAARAGTTGGLTGYVCDIDTGKPVAGAVVTAVSPAQVSKTTTDASGYYVFVGLVPGTYTISVERPRYQPLSMSGVPVVADVQLRVNIRMYRAFVMLSAHHYHLSPLVQPGVIVDIYHVTRSTLPAYGFMTTFSDQLQFVPGVQLGFGSKMMQ